MASFTGPAKLVAPGTVATHGAVTYSPLPPASPGPSLTHEASLFQQGLGFGDLEKTRQGATVTAVTTVAFRPVEMNNMGIFVADGTCLMTND